ncbi:uncharacterized protein LOC126906851 [Daktulosphaira vitifoliae]|uniref:uncharacterized protein LOC126906851 n=1 Tax=Daktulosphaira vitifoliae TaxID=58002 RepID=UPI0021AA7E98|nr:uncharacterized protein LOC126906851 [Daktulosphaira vitifoliae]
MVRKIIFQVVYFFVFFYQLKCELTLHTQQKRNAHFIKLLNDIPGPEYLLLENTELQNFLVSNKNNETFLIWDELKIKQKMWKLGCMYTELSLYIMYHLNFVNENRNPIESEHLDLFQNILHRMISIYYYTLGNATKSIWLTSITIDALIYRKMSLQEIKFDYFINIIYQSCIDCVQNHHLREMPMQYRSCSLLNMIREISIHLKLCSGYHPDTFNEIYQYVDVSNVYSFFWNNRDGFQHFIPTIFEHYNKTHIEKIYRKVCNLWKHDYFILLSYTEAIKKNLLLGTYYILARHCLYLTDYLTKDITSVISNREQFLYLFKIPLNILNEIGVFLSETFRAPFKSILNNMKEDRISTMESLMIYTDNVIDNFNKLSVSIMVAQLKFTDYNYYESTNYPYNYTIAKNQLLSFADNLQNYFNAVKRGMAPVDFTILRVFALNVKYS